MGPELVSFSLPPECLPASVHRRFMRRAIAVAQTSRDTSRKVGAVVTRWGVVQIGQGANTYPLNRFGDYDSQAMSIDQFVAMSPEMVQAPLKYEHMPHAEENATYDAVQTAARWTRKLWRTNLMPRDRVLVLTKGATLYVNWVNCSSCGEIIIGNQYRYLIGLEPEKWVEPKKWGSFYENLDRLVDAGITPYFIGRRFDATGFCLYPRLKTYDEIKKRDGHIPKSPEPIG